jgi:hypothetical protein
LLGLARIPTVSENRIDVPKAAQPDSFTGEFGQSLLEPAASVSVHKAAQPDSLTDEHVVNSDVVVGDGSVSPNQCGQPEAVQDQTEARRQALRMELQDLLDAREELERKMHAQEKYLQEMLRLAPVEGHPVLQAHFDELAAPVRVRLRQYDELLAQSSILLESGPEPDGHHAPKIGDCEGVVEDDGHD